MQSGFRKGRSTTDQLVRLETFAREAFIQKQHAAVIFFDLVKASVIIITVKDIGALHNQ